MTDSISQTTSYLRLPDQKNTEFWNTWRITHIRYLAVNGKSDGEVFAPPEYRTARRLDLLSLKPGDSVAGDFPDTTSDFPEGVRISAPLYLGDMSFGALSGVPNIAIARAADNMNVVAGTGEGGLLPEVEASNNITVQWASARFGVTADTLKKGIGVVIKIGQGAKPGIGGHLPGTKVTRRISESRKIPEGVDAISPAPHHDIYSIEDLGRRIKMLKILTGKPVFVKVAATNYLPYIASGVARMGGAGIIIDGFGAGTGAAPVVIRDNLGMPIETAVEAAHNALVSEGIREGFKIIAGGRVSTPEDMLKLICLGADLVTLGTAPLIAMGCLMVHKCHQGLCPALLTNKLSDRRPPMSLEFAVKSLENFISGWIDETKMLLSYMGVEKLQDLRGRKDYLVPYNSISNEGADMVNGYSMDQFAAESEVRTDQNDRINMLSGLRGGKAGKPPISSMGSTRDPSLNTGSALLDHLIIDGAQVTRPSLDPHREDIDTHWALDQSISGIMPVFLKVSPHPDDFEDLRTMAESMSVPVSSGEKILLNNSRFHKITLPSMRDLAVQVSYALDNGIKFVDIDEGREDSDVPLGVAVSLLDSALREAGKRNQVQILASPTTMRGSEDIAKLLCLGANGVSITPLVSAALQNGASRGNLENLLSGIRKELKLISGAAGIGMLTNSFTGNREIIRSVGLKEELRRDLDVKGAGV